MSEDGRESAQQRSDRLQRAFDEAAGGRALRLEPAAAAEPPSVGVAFISAPFVASHPLNSPPPTGHADDREIATRIHGFETLSNDQNAAGEWRQHLHDPYVAVTLNGLAQVDQAAVDEWLANPEFQEYQQEYPPQSPRRVKIKRPQIIYIGRQHATITYRVVETYANGKTAAGNGTAMLARLSEGWRIVVITKAGREESHPET